MGTTTPPTRELPTVMGNMGQKKKKKVNRDIAMIIMIIVIITIIIMIIIVMMWWIGTYNKNNDNKVDQDITGEKDLEDLHTGFAPLRTEDRSGGNVGLSISNLFPNFVRWEFSFFLIVFLSCQVGRGGDAEEGNHPRAPHGALGHPQLQGQRGVLHQLPVLRLQGSAACAHLPAGDGRVRFCAQSWN